jgi:hypothetical protein
MKRFFFFNFGGESMKRLYTWALLLLACCLHAEQPPTALTQAESQDTISQDTTAAESNEILRSEKLAQYLSDTDFVGRYTTDGQEGNPPAVERYTIRSCKVLTEPDMYELSVRIRYDAVDTEVPLKVRIVFADQTPVMTIDQMWIPGLGTFDARVLIRKDRYAGTWQHGDHGGHLFGVIEKRKEDAK